MPLCPHQLIPRIIPLTIVVTYNGTKKRRRKKRKTIITATAKIANASKKRNDASWKRWNIKRKKLEKVGTPLWRMRGRRHFMVAVETMMVRSWILQQLELLHVLPPCQTIPTTKQVPPQIMTQQALPTQQMMPKVAVVGWKEKFNGTITGCHPNRLHPNIKSPFHLILPCLPPIIQWMQTIIPHGPRRSTWATIPDPVAVP
mmetsp:Transcript_35238/g.63425  ORF Transcript_35238/g.63425 Transcript_35238/m.63425 type:complete len:201 (+) Transcript_35238:422-1024(+)